MKRFLMMLTAVVGLAACDPVTIATFCTDDVVRQNGGLCDKSAEFVGIGTPPTSEPPTNEPPTSEPPTNEPPTSEPPTSEPPGEGGPTDRAGSNRSGHGDDTNPGGQDSNVPGRDNPGNGKGQRDGKVS